MYISRESRWVASATIVERLAFVSSHREVLKKLLMLS